MAHKHAPHSGTQTGCKQWTASVTRNQQATKTQDFLTRSQCFAVYTAMLATDQPQWLPELIGYQYEMARYVRKYKWPSWVIFDMNFWQEAVCRPILSWADAAGHRELKLNPHCFPAWLMTLANPVPITRSFNLTLFVNAAYESSSKWASDSESEYGLRNLQELQYKGSQLPKVSTSAHLQREAECSIPRDKAGQWG